MPRWDSRCDAGYFMRQPEVLGDMLVTGLRASYEVNRFFGKIGRGNVTGEEPPPPGTYDPNCLGQIKNYQSLATMAYEAHKPMFLLRPADGAIGGHQRAAHDTCHVFRALAERFACRMGLQLPDI
jgi:hypothetical protein